MILFYLGFKTILFTFIHIHFITMNYGGGPYVLYSLLRIKEVMDQDLAMVSKVVITMIPIIKEVTNQDIINTVIRVKPTDIISRIQVVGVETVVLVWVQYAVFVA